MHHGAFQLLVVRRVCAQHLGTIFLRSDGGFHQWRKPHVLQRVEAIGIPAVSGHRRWRSRLFFTFFLDDFGSAVS